MQVQTLNGQSVSDWKWDSFQYPFWVSAVTSSLSELHMTGGTRAPVFLLFLFYQVKQFTELVLYNFMLKTDFPVMEGMYTKCNFRRQKSSSWLSSQSLKSQPKSCQFRLPPVYLELLLQQPTFNLVFAVVDVLSLKNKNKPTWNHRKNVHKIQVHIRKMNLFLDLFKLLLRPAGTGDMR